MRRRQSGFTLIELLVVISIIGVLSAVLLGPIVSSGQVANAAADSMQLRTHAQWFKIHELRHKGGLPGEGGHRFVLSTWTSGIFDHTEENLDRFFTPGARDNDPDYRLAREQMERGVDPWPTLAAVSTLDTHYVGRARQHLRSVKHSGREAWMATDNEGIWTMPDGTVNVLLNGGVVREYSYQDLQGRFGLGAFDSSKPVATHGAASPIPECRKLAN